MTMLAGPALALALLAGDARAGEGALEVLLAQALVERELSAGEVLSVRMSKRSCLRFVDLRDGPAFAGVLVLRTEDRGQRWSLAAELPGTLEEVYRLDDAHVWALTHLIGGGALPVLSRSVNGGATWTELAGIEGALQAEGRCCASLASGLRFEDPARGSLVADGLSLETLDGGASFSPRATPAPSEPPPRARAPRWCE